MAETPSTRTKGIGRRDVMRGLLAMGIAGVGLWREQQHAERERTHAAELQHTRAAMLDLQKALEATEARLLAMQRKR